MRTMRSLMVVLAAIAVAGPSMAQKQPQPAATEPWILAVSEGTSGGLDHARVRDKYGGLAEVIGRAAGRKVNVVFAREFSTLDEGMASGRLDLVFARPSDYPARGVRDHRYHFVASASPEGQCLVIVPKDSPIKSLADAKGKRWVLPEQVSYMSRFCAAELRDRGILVASEKVQFVREQAAVPFYMLHKFSDVGAVASYSGVAKKLDADGFRVLHASVKQPYFPLVANERVTPAQLRSIQAALAALPTTDEGKLVLKTIGVQGFDTTTGERLGKLLAWLAVDTAK
jgi:phosphonate transport system substrate-binding protein